MKLLLLLIQSVWLIAGTLHLSASSNPARLNPLIATDSASSSIAGFVFNALVKYDESGQNVIGDLAESYRFITPTLIEFKLRRGVTWHDGTPFTARDVAFTYELIRSPKVITPYASDFRVVKSLSVINDHTVRVAYEKPYFKALEIWMMGIVPRHILERESDVMGSRFNAQPVGTGPYILKKLEFSRQIVLEANPRYFEGAPKIGKIVFHVIADPMTRFLMLKSGAIDISSLEPMQYERQLDPSFHRRFKTLELPSHSYTYLGFNLRLKKFRDPRVREALSLAIDRQALSDLLFLGHAKVCTGPFLPGSRGYNDQVKPPKRDIRRAKALLRAAGYDAKNPLSFEIATSNSNMIRPYAAEILQRQLAEAGVRVSLRVMEWQAFLNTVVAPRQFDTVLLGWALSLTPDPYALWHSQSDVPGGFNLVGYRSSQTDRLIEAMERSTDPERIAALQRRIYARIAQDNPYLFLVVPNDINVYSRSIKGVKPTINGIWEDYIRWEKH